MKRLTRFVKHIVRDVGDVVDGTLSDRLQTFYEPLWRWPNLDSAHESRGIARTEILVTEFQLT